MMRALARSSGAFLAVSASLVFSTLLGCASEAQRAAGDAGSELQIGPKQPLPQADGGPGTDGASATCTPVLTAYSATPWIAPGAKHRNACTPQQTSFLADCYTTTDEALLRTCTTFEAQPQNAACLACAVTSGDTTTPRGALHYYDGSDYSVGNVEGCVALMGSDSSPTSCGARLLQYNDCLWYRCGHCDDDAARWACEDQMSRSSCAAYAGALGCAEPFIRDDNSACYAATDAELARKLIALFCGPP